MIVGNKTDNKIQIRLANHADRQTIYSMRHSVYATELSQHAENEELILTDSLDEFNVYIVAEIDDKVVGQAGLLPVDLNVLGKKVKAIWFVDFAILPKFQNQGFGKKL